MIARPKVSQNEWKTTEIGAWQSWKCLTLFPPRPNAQKRVLVDFGRKGLYNYACDTQLTCVTADDFEASDCTTFNCGAHAAL